jgi:hypothetical protein
MKDDTRGNNRFKNQAGKTSRQMRKNMASLPGGKAINKGDRFEICPHSTPHNYQNDPITKKQIALLHVARQELGLDDDIYHDMLESVLGVSSSTEITKGQFEKILDHLKSHGFSIKRKITKNKKYDEFKNRSGMATPAQMRYLEVMFHEWLDLKYPDRDNKAYVGPGLRYFLRKHYQADGLRFLSKDLAVKAIEGMKNALAHARAKNPAAPTTGEKKDGEKGAASGSKSGSKAGENIKRVW